MDSGPIGAVADVCRRIDAVDGRLHSFVPEPDRLARLTDDVTHAHAEAGSAERPLLGIPVGVKDIITVDGLPMRAGSTVPAEEFAGPEASAVGRLRRAGALIAGKTATAEFAYADPAPTVNPHDPRRSPGGSSSGSAAAVAAGIVPIALGTQTVDSVITPASYCGVVGYKPTYGRVPADGVLPFSRSMDHLGVLAASIEWVARAATVLIDGFRSVPAPGQLVLGIPAAPFLEQAETATLEQFQKVVDVLRGRGHRTVAASLPFDPQEITTVHRHLNAAQFFLEHRSRFERYGFRYRPRSAELFSEGEAIDNAAVGEGERSGRALRHLLMTDMDRGDIDAWVAPAATGAAPIGLDARGNTAMAVPWTHAHLPAVTVPAGAVDGLPIGLQVIGRYGADEELLAVAGWVVRIIASSIEPPMAKLRA